MPGTHLLHILLELRVTTLIPCCADLIEKPNRSESRIELQARSDDAFVGIQLGGLRRSSPIADRILAPVPIQLPGLDPAVDGAPLNAQFTGDGRLRHALFQIVSEQHVLLRSVHRASDVCVESRRWGIGRVGAQLIELTLGASQPNLQDRRV